MSRASVLARSRRAAEALMVDSCAVKYVSGTTFDEATGREVPTYTTRYSSACKVQATGVMASDAELGGRLVVGVRLEVHLPWDVAQPEVGDLIEVTAVGAGSDSDLVGRSFTVKAPMGKTSHSARRVPVEEVVG